MKRSNILITLTLLFISATSILSSCQKEENLPTIASALDDPGTRNRETWIDRLNDSQKFVRWQNWPDGNRRCICVSPGKNCFDSAYGNTRPAVIEQSPEDSTIYVAYGVNTEGVDTIFFKESD